MDARLVILSLVVASAAATLTVQEIPPCNQFPRCKTVPFTGCPPDDEDCHDEGSGSGSGASGFGALDTCMGDSRIMVLKCPPVVGELTPEPTRQPVTNRPATSKLPPVGTVTRLMTKKPNINTDRPVRTFEPVKPGQPNGNGQNVAEKEEDDESQDKGWMIGIIVGCVIGSAILGVLAAVIVIKLKFSGEKSGSYQTTERGSTGSAGSTSSQKPLYV